MTPPFKSLKDWAAAFDKKHPPEQSERPESQPKDQQQAEPPKHEPVVDIGEVDFSDVDWERGSHES